MLTQLREAYRGKKVFLTGHTGFKGSWLLKTFHLLGAEITGYALETQNEFDLYNLIAGDRLCNSVIDDLRNRERLIAEVKSFQPDYVFHLAAQSLVRFSYEAPSETFEVNAVGTANLLDAVKELEKPCSNVLITTDKVYHNHEWHHPYRENDRLGGHDPYSASKACAEFVINSYRNSFFHPANYNLHKKAIAVARAGNVVGGGDWAKDRLLPDIARALGNHQPVIIRNPSAVRPWQHVMEPLLGYLTLGIRLSAEPLKYSQPYNFGPFSDDALSVEEMVQLAIQNWKSGKYEIQQIASRPHEASFLKLDISKAVAELKWKPRLTASEAISDTVQWYKAFFEKKVNMSDYTERQITNFIGHE
jgi:CDP-glucose 4,6-dehydratase